MLFSLDVLPARKGDCLMIHYGSENNEPHLILIDGGPSNVYKPHLKPRLALVHRARELEEQDALPVEVTMVSHVDDDHIKGILELTKEQIDGPDLRLDVTSLWHNSFDDLLGTKPDELMGQANFGEASFHGSGSQADDAMSVLASAVRSALTADQTIKDEDKRQMTEVLASIPQGRTLRDDAKKLGWKLNHKFKGKLILAADAAKPVTLPGGLDITVVGPMREELEALQDAHDKWLRNRNKKGSSEAALAAFVDNSVSNLSSIVILAELNDKKMLLTGDARGDKILSGLELRKRLDADGKIEIDLLKVPHHGSANNLAVEFFERIIAKHYVFSGDGEHGNPERESLEMLLKARGNADYTIHLTYPIDEIDTLRKEDWENEQTKEKNRKKKKVRDDWSRAKHSLRAFFDRHPDMEKKVQIVDPTKPHLINLLEPASL